MWSGGVKRRFQTRPSFWIKSFTSGWVQESPWYQKSNKGSLLRDTQLITWGDIWRTTRTDRLLAVAVGVSAIVTEKLGCDRPGCKKYFTRGPCPPIAVEIKMVPDTPVWAVVRFAISTTSSTTASSSANGV